MLFQSRREAGLKLAEVIPAAKLTNALILAIPRGGVPVGAALREQTGLPLDVVVTRKIGAPFNPELAVGAITPTGEVLLNEAQLAEYQLSRDQLEEEIERQKQEQLRRVTAYRGSAEYEGLSSRTLILVDDGVATGLTMKAALVGLAKEDPQALIVAVPVAPRRTLQLLAEYSDEVYCLHTPHTFFAVSQFYADFHQVSDREVAAFLQEAGEDPNDCGAHGKH